MICLDTIEQFHIEEPTALTIGKFDGLHRGHEELLSHLLEKREEGLKTVAFTFDIPPKRLTEGEGQQLLSTNQEKRALFAERGIDYLVLCPFTPEIMCMEPEDFVDWIVTNLNVRRIVVGEDCCFGHNRRGDHKLLEKLSDRYGYELKVVRKLKFEGRDISSTYIREEIVKGNMEIATELLGHPYSIDGIVETGNQLGRTIGIPTANIEAEPGKLLPPFGVYASSIDIGTERYYGIANIGRKPTIKPKNGDRNPIGVEMHILNFSKDIYREPVRISFYVYERPEIRFDSISDLQAQIKKDIVFSEAYFGK
ncbi:MAG: bifunctional riboflavin kinase/FAD synthetase [bacterium]|nr:bifunctional riboflavin kinase/FAD synthetase [bacterium]MDY4100651.1 bifunctional riboflavin kinase/FAD synthetase [Lachnospiraceae bacterium]